MSGIGLNLSEEHHEHHEEGPPRRPRKRRGGLIALLVLLALAAGVAYAGLVGYQRLKEHFTSPPDYPGPGRGSLIFEVKQGQTVAEMGRGLRAEGVVKSVDGFLEVANADPKAATIQVGFYQMKRKMSSAGALAVLEDPANLMQSTVTITEGARVRDIVKAIVDNTDLKRRQITAALNDPEAIGLPAAAHGNPEGYLYPATYSVPPRTTAVEVIREMVAKTVAVERDLGVATKAGALGLTPEQVLTVASILEYEANRTVDYPKVARVIYNRLDKGMALQMDSTVTYISGRQGDVWTTARERGSDSAYNTYQHPGLPPGPIGSPGEATIDAALHPAKGPWLYFVPDFEKGTTLFTDSYAEHTRNANRAKEYCRTHKEC